MSTNTNPTPATNTPANPLEAVYRSRKQAAAQVAELEAQVKELQGKIKTAAKNVEVADKILIPAVKTDGPQKWDGDFVYVEEKVVSQRPNCGPKMLIEKIGVVDPSAGMLANKVYDDELAKQATDLKNNPKKEDILSAKPLGA